MKLSDRLRSLREAAGLTQKGVADRLGIPVTTYRSYEYKANAQPGISRLKEIAKILGITLDELAGVNESERLICYFAKMGFEVKRYGQTPNFLVLSGKIININEAQIIVREVEKMLNPLAKVIVDNKLHKEKEAQK